MQENQGLKKKQFFSAQVDLSKFKGNDFEKATEDEKKQQHSIIDNLEKEYEENHEAYAQEILENIIAV